MDTMGVLPDLAIVNCTALVGTAGGRAQFAPGSTIEVTVGCISALPAPARAPCLKSYSWRTR